MRESTTLKAGMLGLEAYSQSPDQFEAVSVSSCLVSVSVSGLGLKLSKTET